MMALTIILCWSPQHRSAVVRGLAAHRAEIELETGATAHTPVSLNAAGSLDNCCVYAPEAEGRVKTGFTTLRNACNMASPPHIPGGGPTLGTCTFPCGT